MSREIKFRAWDNAASMMLSSDDIAIALQLNGDVLPLDLFASSVGMLALRRSPKNERYTLMQFTGLHDKNGKEIYEGDIVFNANKHLLTLVNEYPRTYVVEWREGKYNEENTWLRNTPGFIFRKLNPVGKRYMELIFNQSQIEIVGNIYENPELLKEENK